METNTFIPCVRIFVQNEDGSYADTTEDYDLNQLLGVVPDVGDIIVTPWVSGNADRQDPINRTFLKVEKRYFCPQTINPNSPGREIYVYVNLVVTERPGAPQEGGIFNN